MNKLTIAFVLLLLANISFAKPMNEITSELDAYISQQMDESNMPGSAVVIVEKNKIVFMKGYGVRSLKNNLPVDSHTVFRIASLSKAFGAELMGVMEEHKKLKLDDKVVTYLPHFRLHNDASTKNLTIRHLLSHSTGLPPHASDTFLENNHSLAQAVAALKTVPLTCKVGECYSYQNVAFSINAIILESITKKSYSQLLSEYFFRPLKMDDASVTRDALIKNPNHADCHERGKSSRYITCPINTFSYVAAPAAGINASISDMSRWLLAQTGGYPDIISPRILKMVQTPEIESPDEIDKAYDSWRKERLLSAYYGLGWRIFDYAGTSIVYHGGALRGTSAAIAIVPQAQVGIVFLNNTNESLPGSVVSRFLDLYLTISEKTHS